MPTLQEQQEQIAALRLQREQSSGELYRAQLRLHATNTLLRRVSKKETSLPPNVQQIAALRVQIEKLQADIRTINEALNGISSYAARVKQQEQYLDFLQKKKTVTTARIQENEQRVQEEETSQIPDKKLIAALLQEITQLEKLLPELDQNIATAQNELVQLKDQQQQAMGQQQQLLSSKKELQNKLASLEADLAGLLQQHNGTSTDEVLQTLKKQQGAFVKAKQQHLKDDIALSGAIAQIYVDPHPRRGVQQLNDNIPFLFMPVRIETRFITSGNVTELWLRIYPDDIAIHTHEQLLTEKELKDGIIYWKALFEAEKNGGAEKETMKKAAWNVLARTHSPQRAAWVALQTKPTNWSDDLSNIENADGLVFPSPELTKPDSWSRAPRVNVLPDRFVVSLYEGNTVTKEVVGNLIPDELFVGPDPMDADAGFVTKEDKLVFGESYDWTSDFDKAIINGMGFKIPLTATQAANGFDKILVLGVNLSANEWAGQQMVEELINNHHYSPKGFSIIPQGSATNNTDDNGSGYTKNDDFSDTSYVVEAKKPLFSEVDDCDGKNLANALGIEYTPLQNIANSNGKDLAEAVAMNTALFPATLGYYFDTMLRPVLSEAQQDKLRSFFVHQVTGRGPLPAIRVGDQPYGVLLTSNFEAWTWNSTLPVPGIAMPDNRFLNGLYGVLKAYSAIWKGLLSKLSYVGKPGSDPSEVLMDIIGLQPNSAAIFQRIGYSTDYLKNLDSFKYGGKYYKDLSQNMTSKTDALGFLQQLGYTFDENGELKVPQLLRLIYQHYHTTLDAANLIDNVPLSEKDHITYYNEGAEKNYMHWLAEITDLDALEKQDFGAGKPIPAALLYMQLRRSLSLQLHSASRLWFRKNNFPLEARPANFLNIRPGGDLSKWEMMRANVSKAAPDHPQRNSTIGAYLLGIGRDEDEAAFLSAMRNAIGSLAGLPTARLERCFIEHLDVCNYRLDAWQTGMFNVRLSQQRRLQTAERQKGIYLGSYGWVEHVRPSGKRKVVTDPVPEKLKPANNRPLYEYTDNGGFVHAPSLNHASAAAVLRSAYMSHATPADPDVMAVNLSSERVRRALFILDGMRNGQSLEALLGYQFERGLHDRGSEDDDLKKLNLYIYDYRAAFPLMQHVVQQVGTGTVQESIPANNVVNGVTLAEKGGTFPFGATGAVLSASAAERDAIIKEKDKLADTLDAVKDLLSAESVYQLVQGNFERCGALLNAVKDAVIPAELDVIETPRGSQFTFTNRVTIQFGSVDATDPVNNPWSAVDMTVRAKMEAGLNKWLGKVIGDPAKIVFTVAYFDALELPQGQETWTLDKLGIQPVDLIYITGGELNTGTADKTSVSELESRIAWHYRRGHGLDDSTAISIAFTQPDNVVGAQPLAGLLPLLGNLRAVITDSRYVDAVDFDPSSKKSMADKLNPKALDDVELLARVQAARVAFQANIGAINALLIQAEIPDPDADDLLTVYNTLEAAFKALDKAKLTFDDITFTFGNLEAGKLQDALVLASQFGIPDAFPKRASVLTTADKAALLEQARGIVRRMTVAYKTSGDIITAAASQTVIEEKVKEYRRAGKLVLQEAFNILPLFSYNNEADILLSHNDKMQLLDYAATKLQTDYMVEEWMQQAAHVRPRLLRWEQVRSLYELDHKGEDLKVDAVQLPYRAKDSWLAVEFPETDVVTGEPFNILHDTLSVVVHGDAFTPASRQSGLLIDDWTETIPTKEETTGITFNYNQPNATPPQALLLAVTPEVKGHWTWEDLTGILNDTLQRAKLRAVEPRLLDEVNHTAVSVLRPALVADFTQYDLNVSLDYRLNLVMLANALPITSVASL